ncbi:pyridoxal phosphate-dependent decarboxylase family protein [Paracoccus benzoatiresistens]|uniref:Pyridoxal-dependent decarboxylase n=1 Tax=Paracoccus benzoatiresistens TaxID=2997341 RepID=A0ABT4J2Q4_9RHOB|nr:pyridoxal-dependent decarboxylase [Paracoccus sp. EF6]MCZ0960935.1 pyridoxal-dependent decarboxylase [Paracoccus sp. EF6]
METLDPTDWGEFARIAHKAVDEAIARTAALRDRPVWRPMPPAARKALRQPLPVEPTPLDHVVDEAWDTILAYPMGNTHPRFWMWYMGASSLTGALADFLAAADGSNLGGGDHAAAECERQVIDWLRQIAGFPEGSSGTLTSGGSEANLIGLTVARNRAIPGIDLREGGLAALPRPLRFYASDQVHGCHQKAVELLGLGNRALRRIPTGPDCRMDVEALARAIEEDRAQGWQPACVIATAGTVNTGAIDPLPAMADLCRDRGLWLHVDGCIGALTRLSPRHAHLLDGIDRADSLALDPHKSLHVPFEAGCVLVRDARAHLGSFALHSEYLDPALRGIAAGGWLLDLGLQTSRGFRALKIWMMLREHGTARLGRIIGRNIDQARRLAALAQAHPRLTLLSPVTLDIACFRYDPGGLDPSALAGLNAEIMMRLQEDGTVAFSDTTVHGEHGLRAAICNHRTTDEDIGMALAAVVRTGDALATTHAPTHASPA